MIRILEQDFIRDIVTPGKESTTDNLLSNAFPVYSPSGEAGEVTFRYMRYWIERGHERAGRPLTKDELDALDTLDRYLKDPRYMVSFFLEQGDMIYFNNKTVAHNRTEFKDTPENIRLLWRMWIDSSSPNKQQVT